MVKGISRRVIVVRIPDQSLFDQAIFLMKEDAAEQQGVTAEQIMDQAKEAANSYLRKHNPRQMRFPVLKRYKGWLWFLAGAFCAGVSTALIIGM